LFLPHRINRFTPGHRYPQPKPDVLPQVAAQGGGPEAAGPEETWPGEGMEMALRQSAPQSGQGVLVSLMLESFSVVLPQLVQQNS
jgi:hypothetical protein